MNMEQWARVRRKVLVDKQSKRSVMSEEGLHWETLQKMLEHSHESIGFLLKDIVTCWIDSLIPAVEIAKKLPFFSPSCKKADDAALTLLFVGEVKLLQQFPCAAVQAPRRVIILAHEGLDSSEDVATWILKVGRNDPLLL